MLGFLLKRLLLAASVLLAVSFVIFSLSRLVPVSPALLVLGPDAAQPEIHAFEKRYGLDRPLLRQYASWLGGVVTKFDLGPSFVSGRPVTEEISQTLPVTLELILVAMLICLSISIPFGVLSAFYRGSLLDHALRIFSVLGVSTPGFWLGLVLILVFAVDLGWLPPGDLPPISDGLGEHLKALILPAFCLAIYYTAIISRMTRSSVLEVLSQDYARTAIAAGLSKTKIRFVYVLKNALIPIVSVAAMACGYMFGWAIVIEQVFNIPGLCRSLLAAIFARDYNLVQAAVLVIALAFVSLNLLADLAFRLLNPSLSW